MIREEFLRLLREDEAFREEVRRQILTDRLLELPDRVEENFARAFRLIEENSRQIAELREQVRGNTGQIAALAERMERVEAQIAALTERMERVEAQIEALTRAVSGLAGETTVSRWGAAFGVFVEDRARDFFAEWLPGRGLRLLGPFHRIRGPDWEIDGAAPAEGPDGRVWILVEAKGRADGSDVVGFARLLGDERVRAFLRDLGLRGRAEAWVFAVALGWSVEEAAEGAGVGLVEPRFGALVEPRPFEL